MGALSLPTDAEIDALAAGVNRARQGLPERLVGDSAYQARRLGFLGQRAVCAALGVPGEFRVLKHRGTGRACCTAPSGDRVAVVTRTRVVRSPDLILRVAEKPQPELALVLVIWEGDGLEPTIVGWVREHTVRSEGEVREFRDEPNYVWPGRRMRPLAELRRPRRYEQEVLW